MRLGEVKNRDIFWGFRYGSYYIKFRKGVYTPVPLLPSSFFSGHKNENEGVSLDTALGSGK